MKMVKINSARVEILKFDGRNFLKLKDTREKKLKGKLPKDYFFCVQSDQEVTILVGTYMDNNTLGPTRDALTQVAVGILRMTAFNRSKADIQQKSTISWPALQDLWFHFVMLIMLLVLENSSYYYK